jgi:MYXO-CTERM domain-containing protein
VLSNRGLVVPNVNNQDGADSAYSLRCNEAYNVNTAAMPTILPDDKGALLMVTTVGMSSTADRGCSFQPVSGLPDISLGAFAQNPSMPGSMLITTDVYQSTAQLFSSQDYGHTWSVKGSNTPYSVYLQFLTGADGMQILAAGQRYDMTKKKLVSIWSRSTDGGATWMDQDLDKPRFPLGYHPTDSKVVFARESDPSQTMDPTEKLLRSEDGGSTFSTLQVLAPLTSFAASPDGSHIWVGTSLGGLLGSTDGGKTFQAVSPDQVTRVTCLAYRQGVLWVCANFPPNINGVWSSADLGQTWKQQLDFAQISTQVSCNAGNDTRMSCVQPWKDWQFEVSSNFTIMAGSDASVPNASTTDAGVANPSMDGGFSTHAGDAELGSPGSVSAADGGATPAPKHGDGGCSCSVAPELAARGQLSALLLSALGLLLARRRRHLFARAYQGAKRVVRA